jgi:hypothetical protein
MDETGFLYRPRLRAAYNKICDGRLGNCTAAERCIAAEAFLNTIARVAQHRGISFDQCAEQLGY